MINFRKYPLVNLGVLSVVCAAALSACGKTDVPPSPKPVAAPAAAAAAKAPPL